MVFSTDISRLSNVLVVCWRQRVCETVAWCIDDSYDDEVERIYKNIDDDFDDDYEEVYGSLVEYTKRVIM